MSSPRAFSPVVQRWLNGLLGRMPSARSPPLLTDLRADPERLAIDSPRSPGLLLDRATADGVLEAHPRPPQQVLSLGGRRVGDLTEAA